MLDKILRVIKQKTKMKTQRLCSLSILKIKILMGAFEGNLQNFRAERIYELRQPLKS